MAKNKNPRANWQPNGGKQPRGGSLGPNISTLSFKWRSDQLDWGSPWCWSAMGIKQAFGEIVPKLQEYESMTWGELEGPTGSHFVDCTDLIKAAQDRLTEISENADQLFSLRIAGKYRVWGVRDVAILRLLWWDPAHEVCPSPKKYT